MSDMISSAVAWVLEQIKAHPVVLIILYMVVKRLVALKTPFPESGGRALASVQ